MADNPTALLPGLRLWLDETPRAAALNMALDQALLELADGPVLRVYDWDRPSYSIGCSHDLAAAQAAHPGVPVVQRWTGGGVVAHGGDDATYALVVPAAHPFAQTRPLESYRQIHGSLAHALQAVGQGTVMLVGPEEVKSGALCFAAPALHDVMRGGVKIAGAGQRRSRLGLLHQGSVQLRLEPGFWLVWAASLCGEAPRIWTPGHELFVRAEELVITRYAASPNDPERNS